MNKLILFVAFFAAVATNSEDFFLGGFPLKGEEFSITGFPGEEDSSLMEEGTEDINTSTICWPLGICLKIKLFIPLQDKERTNTYSDQIQNNFKELQDFFLGGFPLKGEEFSITGFPGEEDSSLMEEGNKVTICQLQRPLVICLNITLFINEIPTRQGENQNLLSPKLLFH